MKQKNCCASLKTVSSASCGCCEGVEQLTPRAANRPGLSELAYRIGTHTEFLETMQARLSSHDFPELAGLTTRDSSDPSLALLDAWAAVADVLTFYQERIANEGYLCTAKERRSILELGRLVGYKMRPGVSASAFLAYTIDDNIKEEVTIRAGSRVQSIPGPDEMPQTFESSEDLKARSGWNNLRPRMTQPQTEEMIKAKNQIYLKGISTNLRLNDPLLIDFGDSKYPVLCWVKKVEPDAKANRTLVILGDNTDNTPSRSSFIDIIRSLTKRSSLPPRNSLQMKRRTEEQFAEKSGSGYRTLESTVPALRGRLTAAAKNANFFKEGSAPQKKVKIYALRKKAAPFGHNAPLQPVGMDDSNVMKYKEWHIKNPIADVDVPNAFFTYKATGLNVIVYNKSTPIGLIDTVIWDFDDNTSLISLDTDDIFSEQQHTYSSHGEYKVSLLVKGPGGTVKYTEIIEVAVATVP